MAPRSTTPVRLVFRPETGPPGDVLVLLLLRGGMDGLHVVPPHADAQFESLRGAVSYSDRDPAGGIINLDGFYGLHPSLAHLEPLYREGSLAIVHACGSPDRTLSHFEASKTIERGASSAHSIGSGWLGRHLTSHLNSNQSPMRAVSFSPVLPDALVGGAHSIAIQSLSDFRFAPPANWGPSFSVALNAMYALHDDRASQAGRDSFRLMRDIEKLSRNLSSRKSKAGYPAGTLGRNFSELAELIRGEVGLEVAVVEYGGWDTHVNQAPRLSSLMTELATALNAFSRDLRERMKKVTVVAMSEFGRRVHENSAQGTDHGWGTAMFLLGGSIRGGRVHGTWPGLARDQLDPNGNLRVTTDYRHVLAELVEKRLRNQHVSQVFPSFSAIP